jgi:hypothetical protein
MLIRLDDINDIESFVPQTSPRHETHIRRHPISSFPCHSRSQTPSPHTPRTPSVISSSPLGKDRNTLPPPGTHIRRHQITSFPGSTRPLTPPTPSIIIIIIIIIIHHQHHHHLTCKMASVTSTGGRIRTAGPVSGRTKRTPPVVVRGCWRKLAGRSPTWRNRASG